MHSAFRACLTAGIAIAGAGLIAVPPVTPPAPDVEVRPVQLTNGDTADFPLGDGTALVMGPSGFAIPAQTYVDAADTLYLRPLGFTGTAQSLATPEGLYPATGVKSLPFDPAVAQGQQILDSAIGGQVAGGHVVVFGFSQSTTVSTLTMSQLADQGVPSDDVHFVLVGDTNNPSGGLFERFDGLAGTPPSLPSIGFTLGGGPTPDDLYPTDIYTNEYDVVADFPRYPIDLLSDLNAALGTLYEHATYLVLTPQQIASAVELPTSAADTLTNYWMIPADTLLLLTPLKLLPFIGQLLHDLLEPDMRDPGEPGLRQHHRRLGSGSGGCARPVRPVPDGSQLG